MKIPLPETWRTFTMGDMVSWQIKATRHGYENPRSLSAAAMLREDSQPRTGVVAT